MFLRRLEMFLRLQENILQGGDCFRSPGENVFRHRDYYLPRRIIIFLVETTFCVSQKHFSEVELVF